MSFTTVDLFAGVGGLTLGFSKARHVGPDGKSLPLFDVRLLVDSDKDAARTYLMNDQSRKFLVADIAELTADRILQEAGLERGKLDVLVGGPPCQGFSAAGRRAIDDPKNALVKRFLELAVELQPRMVIMENVPQVRNWNRGQFWQEICALLTEGNFGSADCRVLNAYDFGVAQFRRRAILVAYRGDVGIAGFGFPEPKMRPVHKPRHTIPDESEEEEEQLRALLNASAAGYVSVEQAIGDLPPLEAGQSASAYTREPFTSYQKARRGHNNFLFNHEARGHSKDFLEKKVKKIAPGKSNQDLPRGERFERENQREDYHSQAYGRLHPKQIAQTITTHFMNPGSGRFTHWRDHRTITVREAARIQSFDDSFVFYGDLVDQQRHVGNAVPPLMARGIGEFFGAKLLSADPAPRAAAKAR